MTTASNLYAQKVFAEHPIGLWTLDEPADYVSLITEQERALTSWTVTGATASEFTQDFPAQKLSSVRNKVLVPNSSGTDTHTVTMTSSAICNKSELDTTLGTFSLSGYFYSFGRALDISIGYEYTNSSSIIVNSYKDFSISSTEDWIFLSETFDIPAESFTNLKVSFKVAYDEPTTDYFFIIHGVTAGQWSENFHVESLGSTLINIPSDININGMASEAKAYGLNANTAYYLSNGKTLAATNSGVPLVYGASASTRLIYNNDNPSVIVPGLGFMNEDGQYKDLTLEFWARIQTSAISPKRIVGPISSDDGLYVHDGFFSLKVGKNVGTYFVTEWDRPMLLAIRISTTHATLLVNGEEVIGLSFLESSLSYPARYVSTYDNDWIGFYAHPDVSSIEIDSVAIYPYIVPSIVEKRRWVYGQAVDVQSAIGDSDIESSVVIDYPFAKYAKNYLYPDIGKWQQGINENLIVENNTISLPQYEKPQVVFNGKTSDEWYTDIAAVQTDSDNFISLRPNEKWSVDGYIMLPKFNILNQEVKAFYGLFDITDRVSRQTLMYLENDVTGDNLDIYIEEDVVHYNLKYLDVSGDMIDVLDYTEQLTNADKYIVVGLDISKFVASFGGKVATFFGSKQDLKMYIGGRKGALNTTMSGKIFSVGFCTARNLKKIKDIFGPTGTVIDSQAFEAAANEDAGNAYFGNEPTIWTKIFDGGSSYFGNSSAAYQDIIDGGGIYSILANIVKDHIPSYGVSPKMFLGNYILDVAVNGYWQDYVPLSYLAKFVTDGATKKQAIDFIQFNIGYPNFDRFLSGNYDTTNSVVKTYVSFQYLSESSNADPNYFIYQEYAPQNKVVIPGADWLVTKYEVVNDTVIYIPQGVDFKTLAIAVHIEVTSNGITESPVKIRSLQLASQALSKTEPNTIGTRYGAQMIPYRKSGSYFDYGGTNPFSIYKGSTPYLYLTANSGIGIKKLDNLFVERGISVPVNKSVANFYKISAYQMNLRFDDESFPLEPKQIFEIQAKSDHIKFFIVADSQIAKRGKIYAVDATTGRKYNGISFYINGKLSSHPTITSRSWATIGITFASDLDFSRVQGAFRINGAVLMNNIIHYKASADKDATRFAYRRWFSVKSPGGVDKDWDFWTPSYTWSDVLFITVVNVSGIDGAEIYRKYTGTNNIVIDSDDTFSFQDYQYMVYKDLGWSAITTTSA
jgi:hypothetical protein